MNKARDPYRWMEKNSTPRVQEWLKRQAAKSERYFRNLPVREVLKQRFIKLFAMDTTPTPSGYKGKYFTVKRLAGQDMAVVYVQDGLKGEPRVVIDPNVLSEDKSVTLQSWAPTEDGQLMAYELSTAGNDKASIHVMNVETGEKLADVIPDDHYPSFNDWNLDKTGFWYAKHDPREPMAEAKLFQRLYYHRLGTDWRDDPIVFGEGLDKESRVGGGQTSDGRYFVVSVYGQDKGSGREWTESYLRDLEDPDGRFVQVIKQKPGTMSSVHVHGDHLYYLTNDGAPRWQVLRHSLAEVLAGTGEPQLFLPEGPGVIETYFFIGDRLFVDTMENVHSVLREYDRDAKFVREIPMPTLGSIDDYTYEEDGSELFFSFASYAVPKTVYRLDLKTDALEVFAQAAAGFDASQMVTEQVWYSSKDGTRIPMFLIYRKGMVRDGDRPTVLYGYGGFDISLTPGFTKSIVPFLERGGIYAVANLRGGGEFGQAWHEAGMQKNKQNVFDDFAAAIRWLYAAGYTRKERLCISGGSNGGLLTLVTAIQSPDLFRAAVSDVPVADMLRYQLFFGGVYWIPDYGDPDDPVMREYLLTYSPYHNVVEGQSYPAILIATSDNDDRVHPMHSYKMAARLQKANPKNTVYLRVELKAGHGGASAISKYVEGAADEWSFIFDQLGLTE